MEKLTQRKLKELLHYDPKTGIFTWKVATGSRVVIGKPAGCRNTLGYISIGVLGRKYNASRLAWLYSHGYFPEKGIDHKDRIRHHNWIDNLQEASQSCNMKNTGNPITNTSGVKGVYWDKSNKKWLAGIMVNYKFKNVGRFNKFDDAVIARFEAEKKYNWGSCDNSSPSGKYLGET